MNPRQELIEKVIDAADELNIDVMLIGAYSRDYWREFFKISATVRTTTDIDFACQVMAWQDYEQLFELLKTKYNLLPDARKKHTLSLRNELSLDLVPFGGIADNAGEISWPPDFLTRLRVLGYDAAKEDAELVRMGDKAIKIMKPYWLALLKLQSYTGDTARSKDLTDFYFLVDNYFECIDEEERIYGNTAIDADVLLVDNFDTRIAAATLIARDCLRSADAVATRIMRNLAEFNKKNELTIALSAAVRTLSADMNHRILAAIIYEFKNVDIR